MAEDRHLLLCYHYGVSWSWRISSTHFEARGAGYLNGYQARTNDTSVSFKTKASLGDASDAYEFATTVRGFTVVSILDMAPVRSQPTERSPRSSNALKKRINLSRENHFGCLYPSIFLARSEKPMDQASEHARQHVSHRCTCLPSMMPVSFMKDASMQITRRKATSNGTLTASATRNFIPSQVVRD